LKKKKKAVEKQINEIIEISNAKFNKIIETIQESSDEQRNFILTTQLKIQVPMIMKIMQSKIKKILREANL